MKRLMVLVLALGLALSFSTAAFAVEIDVKGSFDFAWGWTDNAGDGTRHLSSAGQDIATGRGTEDSFHAVQRERIQVDFIASENVKGTLYFEIGNTVWGWSNAANTGQGTGGRLGTDGVSIEVRRAFITFNVPNTDLIIQPGLQGLTLPAAVMNSPILDNDAAAIVSTYQFNDMVGVGAFWARPFNNDNNYFDAQQPNIGVNRLNNWNSLNDEFDLFGFFVPVTMDGVFSFTPFFTFGMAGTDALYAANYATTNQNPITPWGNFLGGIGSASGNPGLTTNAVGTNYMSLGRPLPPVLGGLPSPSGTTGPYLNNDYQYLYFAGASFEFTMLDPLVFSLDVNWGLSNDPGEKALRRSGWYLAAKAAYKTPWVTPTILGWWSTGDDKNIYNGSERMPTISSQLTATSFGMDGGNLISFTNVLIGSNAYMGTWGAGLELADISFIEDLTHQLRVVFFGGTSHPHSIRDYRSIGDGVNFTASNPSFIMVTTRDWGWELNFDHKYQIYDNLAAYVETGLIDVYRKKGAWINGVNNVNTPLIKPWNTSTAWKLGFGLKYTF